MKIHSYNEYDKLSAVVVGAGNHLENSNEMTFKLFYGLDGKVDENIMNDHLKLQVNQKYINEHIEDVENFSNILKSHNINVYRPRVADKLYKIETPDFKSLSHLTGPVSARDMLITMGDTVVETPPEIRGRYFETDFFSDIKYKAIVNGNKWFTMGKPRMADEAYTPTPGYIEPMLDAARMLRVGDGNVIVNINTAHNELAVKQLEALFPELTFHKVTYVDGHIDSTIAILREGLLLINSLVISPDMADVMLPECIRDYDRVFVEYPEDYKPEEYAGNDILLASKAIDVNVLSLDTNTIICHDYAQPELQKKLNKYNIECVPVQLRHSRIFDGGFRCITSCLTRGL
jgi:glycine amidinotransferase